MTAQFHQTADSLDMNELHRAVHKNRLEAVKFLIEKGADVTYAINKNQTPLYIAVSKNYHDIIEELCKSKSRADVRRMMDGMISRRNSDNCDHATAAIHIAAKNNSIESVRFLLSRGANFDIYDEQVRKPRDLITDESVKQLIISIEEVFQWIDAGDSRVLVEKLSSCPAENLKAMIYARNHLDHSLLKMAMAENNLPLVEFLIDFIGDTLAVDYCLEDVNFDDKLAQYSKAARRCFSNLNGFPVHTNREYTNEKAILDDLLQNSLAFLECYKQHGNPGLDNEPGFIIIEECLEFFGHWQGSKFIGNEIAGSMLNSNSRAFIVKILDLCIVTPMLLFMEAVYTLELLRAAVDNDLAKVEKSLTGHPALDVKDGNGWTALHHAIDHGNEKMAKLLLNFGANPSIVSVKGEQRETPLHFALGRIEEANSWNDPDVLLQMSTPLHIAVKKNNRRLVEFLLKKGCVYCSRDARYKVPSYYSGDEVISKLLKCTEQSFDQARDGKVDELIQALKRFDTNTLLAVCGARNEKNHTLDQVLDIERHADEANAVRKLLVDAKGSK